MPDVRESEQVSQSRDGDYSVYHRTEVVRDNSAGVWMWAIVVAIALLIGIVVFAMETPTPQSAAPVIEHAVTATETVSTPPPPEVHETTIVTQPAVTVTPPAATVTAPAPGVPPANQAPTPDENTNSSASPTSP